MPHGARTVDDEVVVRPLPYDDPERLTVISMSDREEGLLFAQIRVN